MAPVRSLSKKEVNLQQRPWITNGILKSIKERDRLHKLYTKEIDETKKRELYIIYKTKRNLITSLIRKSKSDYYVAYFEENKSDSKKTWEGIRNIVNVSKKVRVVPNYVKYKGKVHYDTKEIAESFNDFFVSGRREDPKSKISL